MVAVAAACVALFVLLLNLAYFVADTRSLDAAALHGFTTLGGPTINTVAAAFASLCNPFPYAIAVIAVIAYALVRRGLRTAAAVTLLLGGANVSSQLLKPLLAHHRELYYSHWHLNNIQDAAFPSGHATAAMSISLALLMVAPRAYRPLVAVLGTLFTLGISFSILILSWHFPSDIVGGYLAATSWGLLTLAALRFASERWPREGTMRQAARDAMAAPSAATLARVAIGLAALACVVAATRADQVATFVQEHTALVAVGSAIAVSAALLLTVVAALSSRRSN
jgi:membrane-associated phospholipid phosphatase